MFILNCPYSGKNDAKGGEQFVNMQFAPLALTPYAVLILQTQKSQLPEIASQRARNWRKRSAKPLRIKNRESRNKRLNATFTTTN